MSLNRETSRSGLHNGMGADKVLCMQGHQSISCSSELLCHCAVRHFLYSLGSKRAHLRSCTHDKWFTYYCKTKSSILCSMKKHKK